MSTRKGNVHITRPLGGRTVILELTDIDTGVQFASAEVNLEDFARALLSATSVPSLITTRGLSILQENDEATPVRTP